MVPAHSGIPLQGRKESAPDLPPEPIGSVDGGGSVWEPADELLRFATAGAVDDGKSTLIGRLLHDSQSLLADQLEALELASQDSGGELDLAMVTDGLRAEREQGITIDVAHRYFETARRAFIIADTPGHAQYTRNMVTGASTADLTIVLVDARHGLTEQSRRHAVLSKLLRVPRVVLAVNKMDLVAYDQGVFDGIVAEFERVLDGHNVTPIPISALLGDNVVERSSSMPWYEGPALLEHLETVHCAREGESDEFRFPVQYVIRSQADDFRGYAGQISGGYVQVGERVVHLPSGLTAAITGIDTPGGPSESACAPTSVTLALGDEIDIGRGDLLCSARSIPLAVSRVRATVCWMTASQNLRVGSRFLLKHTTRTLPAVVSDLHHRLDVTTMRDEPSAELTLNDIGVVELELAEPLFCDAYAKNRLTGGGLLVDSATNITVAAVMIEGRD